MAPLRRPTRTPWRVPSSWRPSPTYRTESPASVPVSQRKTAVAGASAMRHDPSEATLARRADPGLREGGTAVVRRGIPGGGFVPAGAGARPEPAPALLAAVLEIIVACRGGVCQDQCVPRAAGPAKPAAITLDLTQPRHLPRSVAPRSFARRSSHAWRIKPLRIHDSREGRDSAAESGRTEAQPRNLDGWLCEVHV